MTLAALLDETSILTESKLECNDCGCEGKVWSAPYVHPSVKFECPSCKSRNTERFCPDEMSNFGRLD